MPCEREIEAIEQQLFHLAQQQGRRVSGPHWTHRPGGSFRLTVTTGAGDQVLEFPLPEIAEYFHRVSHTREAVQARLQRFVDSLPASAVPPAAKTNGDSGSEGDLTEVVSEALTRIKAIEMVLVKKGLTTKDELNTIVELLQGAHRRS